MVAGTACERRSHLEVLKPVVFKIGRGEPEEPFRDEEVQFDRAARVASDQRVGIVAVHVAPVDGQPELLAARNEVTE